MYSKVIQFYTYVCPSFLRFFSHIVFLFNWSVVALQCCVSFCCKAKRISCTYSCVPSFFGLASHLGRCGALGNIPCALRRVRISYQFMHSGVGAGGGLPRRPQCEPPGLALGDWGGRDIPLLALSRRLPQRGCGPYGSSFCTATSWLRCPPAWPASRCSPGST